MTNLGALGRFIVSELPKKAPAEILLAIKKKKGVGRADITLPTKVCLVKAMIFPVVMYGCESWTVKKAER